MVQSLLTPAEAALLIEPRTGSSPRCMQAALLALLGLGHIEFSEKNGPSEKRRLTVRRSDEALPLHLAAVRNALRDYRHGDGSLSSTQVIHALQQRFGLGYGRFVKDHVAPALIERGLLSSERRKFLGLIPYVRFSRTVRGDALAAPLLRLMRAADDLAMLIAADPERALRLVRSAGILLIMSPKARRQLPALRKLIEQRGDDYPVLTFTYVSDEPEAEWEQILELGDIVLSEETLDLLDSIDAVGDFAGGADGGSSGDGGDGGGGGGD